MEKVGSEVVIPQTVSCIHNEVGWAWKSNDQVGKLLGFPFVAGLDPKIITEVLVAKIKARVERWSTFQLNLQGKGLVCNHLISSTL